MKILALVLLFIFSANIFASDKYPPSKEVFLKGSLDGKSIFMVMGFDKARDINSKIFSATFDKNNVVELGSLINNEDHDNDFAGEIVEGAQISKKHFSKIITSPWKSLSKIPRRFKVNMQKAQEEYYTSKSPGTGAVEYAAIGVWAVLESSYYLVIESPLALAGNLVITSLAIPFKITVQIGKVVLKALKNILYPIGGAIAIAGVTTYSLLSTGVVELALVVNKQLGNVGKGLKYVFSDLPKKINYPITIEKLLNVDLKFQKEVFDIVKEQILLLSPLYGVSLVTEVVMDKESKFKSILYAVVNTPKGVIKSFKVKTVTQSKKVLLSLSMTKDFYRFLKSEAKIDKKELKSNIKNSMNSFIQDVEQMI